MKIKISTSFPEWPLLRQTPGSRGEWGGHHFFVNTDIDECDYWFVYDGLVKKEEVRCNPRRIVLITGEPPSIKRYDRDYIRQFGALITCHRDIVHPRVVHSQQALPWMVGGRFIKENKSWEKEFDKDYDELIDMPAPAKTKVLSIVLSSKSSTEGHRKRRQFADSVKSHFGDKIDIFGVGINVVKDKWTAIAPYRYHLVIENSVHADYWTEKLSDAFLGWSFPLYYGCPNIHEYFSPGSLLLIDISDISKSMKSIENCISSNVFEKSLTEMAHAREKVLNKYNMFAVMAEYCSYDRTDGKKIKKTLYPEKFFTEGSFVKKVITKTFLIPN